MPNSLRRGIPLRLFLIFALILCLALPLGPAQAQDDAAGIPEETLTQWTRQIERADQLLALETASAEELDALRGTLAEQRSDALAAEEAAQAIVSDLRATLESLGPAPVEGETEPEAVARRRATLNQDLQIAQAEALEATEAREGTQTALDRIDARVRAQFSNRLIALGPSPLNPQRWPGALAAVYEYAQTLRAEVERNLTRTFTRNRTLRQLPFASLLILIGLTLLFGVRRRIVGWVEAFLNQNSARKASSWAGAVLNLARLLVPAVGVAALISGIEALALFGVAGRALIGGLPEAATVLILAYWVGHSVFAPQITRYRLIRLEDADARTGARWTFVLGALTGLYLLLGVVLEQQQAPAEVTVVLGFPVLLFAALALWRLAALFRKALKAPEPTNQDGEPAPEPFGLNMIRLLRRFSVLVALLSPVLAAIGYAALSEYLLFSLILSLGLLGGAFVVFTTFLRVLDALMRPPSEDASAAGDPFGLLPVFGGFVIVLVCLPILALIWGARQSDILEVWVWLRDGISIGGSRISLTDFLVFVLVFGIGYTLTRFIQSVLRRTVMPRTRLDVGGQNAVTTGVGYLGIFLAAVVAITATGLDLSNLAIVAGALSVGVGFGLQTIVSNFVSGIILLIERPIKQGDWIEVAGYSGYVRKISVRSTEIETFDRSNVIVPNQELIAESVLNFTHGSMNGRVIVPVGVAYGTDARKVEAILREIAEAHPLVLRRPPPAVIFMGFGADSLDFEIRAILRDVNYMLSVKSDMNFDIYKRFTEEGIEIPFAQRDINIRNPEGIASVLRGAASKEA